MPSRPAAGGGRWVDVDPARLARWLNGFGGRHGAAAITVADGVLRLDAPDGSIAELHPAPGAPPATTDIEEFVSEARRNRRIGLLLARQSAVAIGIAVGPDLVKSKVDTSYVQGRTAAGGWSQHRFARRRENQAKAAAGGAADIAVRLLLPELAALSCVVTGGDRKAVDAVLADARLVGVAAARVDRFLDVPEPRLAVLQAAVGAARAVRIKITDPET
jgi:hypothetical protein